MRRICHLALVLTLGAIVNVAVAWGLFAWHPGEIQNEQLSQSHSDEIWHRWGPPFARAHGASSIERVQYNAFYYSAHAKDSDGRGVFEIVEVGAGWPCYCVVGQLWDNDRVEWVFDLTRLSKMQPHLVGEDSSGWEFVPAYPIWPGFAINTVFYAVVLWLLFAAPLALRRRRRIKRGLCPKCAYDLRGSVEATACPECGAATI